MPTDLERELTHAREMAKAEHKPDCEWTPPRHTYPKRPDPRCTGCVTDADRALWAQLADEYAAQLDRNREDTLL